MRNVFFYIQSIIYSSYCCCYCYYHRYLSNGISMMKGKCLSIFFTWGFFFCFKATHRETGNFFVIVTRRNGVLCKKKGCLELWIIESLWKSNFYCYCENFQKIYCIMRFSTLCLCDKFVMWEINKWMVNGVTMDFCVVVGDIKRLWERVEIGMWQ
jgi:hypothetical protein